MFAAPDRPKITDTLFNRDRPAHLDDLSLANAIEEETGVRPVQVTGDTLVFGNKSLGVWTMYLLTDSCSRSGPLAVHRLP